MNLEVFINTINKGPILNENLFILFRIRFKVVEIFFGIINLLHFFVVELLFPRISDSIRVILFGTLAIGLVEYFFCVFGLLGFYQCYIFIS